MTTWIFLKKRNDKPKKFVSFCFLLLTILSFVSSCTDRRPPIPPPSSAPGGAIDLKLPVTTKETELQPVAEFQFQNANTEVLALSTEDNTMLLTGRPFGFMRLDVGANPERPSFVFAVSDQIDTAVPKGKWVVDWYASGAVRKKNQYAFLSGTAGMSVFSILSTHTPKEVLRYPDVDPKTTEVSRDEAFVYREIIAHPTLPLLYGFREQDYMTVLVLSSLGVKIATKMSYGNNGSLVCCVQNGVVFQNRLFLAFTSRLVWFDLGEDGQLRNMGSIQKLQAMNVTASRNFLFVQHEPNQAQPEGFHFPRGIYVFDSTFNQVDFFPLNEMRKKIAVDPSSNYLYSVKMGEAKLSIERINWTKDHKN